MKCVFLHGTMALWTTQNINSVFGSSVTEQQTISNRIVKLHTGNFDLANELWGHTNSRVNKDKLKVIVESDLSQSAYELSLKVV